MDTKKSIDQMEVCNYMNFTKIEDTYYIQLVIPDTINIRIENM